MEDVYYDKETIYLSKNGGFRNEDPAKDIIRFGS